MTEAESTQAQTYRYEDFTEANYASLVQQAKSQYRFELYGTQTKAPHVIWRHDIDFSPQRALRLAEIESAQGVVVTYCFLLHSEFYNILEPACSRVVQQILALGHQLGLHFDMSYYPGLARIADLEEKLVFEKQIIETIFETRVTAFSYHNPDVGPRLHIEDWLGGLFNAYGNTMQNHYAYCSDSNGYWRYQRLPEVLDASKHPQLHVLTHPGWWTPEAMSPRERISRCIDGRAANVHRRYDRDLAKFGRENVGKTS